ncbi:MAG: ATP-binding protein [Lachnospiraceae bacterium]
MKLKTRLKLSFCIMAVAPIMLISLFGWALVSNQIRKINSQYGIEGMSLELFNNPVEIITKAANQLHQEIEEDLSENPEILEDVGYFENLDKKLTRQAADIVVRKNEEYVYISAELSEEDVNNILPDYGDFLMLPDKSIYYGGNRKCVISQIDVVTEKGEEYSISLIVRLDMLMARLKVLWQENIVVIVLVLVCISGIMITWIYHATIIPLNRLREASRAIAEGNLDFEVKAEGTDEISELCRDFEFMRQKLKESAENSLQSDRESKELIRNISHDLKTPITAVKGYVEGLRDGVAVTEEKRDKYLQTIYNKAVEMDKLIDELTLYSKIDTNRIPYSFNQLSVQEYFADCSDSLMVELEAKGIDFSYSYELDNDVKFIADAEQLGRVINNIISNSIKYHGDRRTEIDMRVKDEGDFIRVEIQDNGMGIAKKDLPHIFERMYRGDESRNSTIGGNGIGLAIVKKIIEEHGGRIWAESKEGEGTTMCFVLRKYLGGSNE